MDTNLAGEKDKEILVSVVTEMSKSMTGAQSTKHWAKNALWFDIVPFASKGIKPACEVFDNAFSGLKSIKVDIIKMETFINGNMGVVCSIQKWNIILKDGTVNAPMLVRQTDCFEKQDGQWKVIHEHSSVSKPPEWDGKIVVEET
ncbi:MAG: nuclear transport factor 2 family protein [Treponema sp.]|jgi:ketosteroid isomerase-like protein|nr:nuclear transport factor 2 family protein [Treponema sp.]